MPYKPRTHLQRIRPKRQDDRPSPEERGYGYQWRKKLRPMVLRRRPICATPGCNRPSEEVDHIVPRSRGGDDSFENLQGLCKMCHSRKTVQHDGGFGRNVVTGDDSQGRGV